MIKWFKKILGITALEDQLTNQRKFNTQLQQDNQVLLDQFNAFRELVGVAVDIQPHRHSYSGSWAAVCLQGSKMDHIHFIDLADRDIQEISRFLRQFERKNVSIDRPLGMDKKMFFS